MDSTPPVLYTQNQVEEIVFKRLKERQQVELLNGLKSQLEDMRDAIVNANHIKSTLGKQLEDLDRLVRTHIEQTRAKFEEIDKKLSDDELGIDNLTPEERAAFPVALRGLLQGQQRARAQAMSEVRRWQIWAAGATVGLLVVTILSSAGVFSWIRTVVFHVP